MKLNLVEDIDYLKNPGDAVLLLGRLIICCPGCGKREISSGKHIFDEDDQTYHPSITHNKNLGGCGWHGWLTNGVFKKVEE